MLEYRNHQPQATPLPARSAETAARAVGTRRALRLGLVAIDLAIVYLAFLVAYWIRYDVRLGPHIRDQLGFDAYRPLVIPVMMLMLIALWSKGAYRLKLGHELEDDVSAAFSSATIAVATLVVLTTMLQRYEYSRGVMLYLWVSLILMVVLGRLAFRQFLSILHRRGIGVRRLLIVGATDVGKMIMQGVAGRRDLGYDLVGFVHTRSEGVGHSIPRATGTDFGRFRNLGFATDVPDLTDRERVDEVIIALPASAHEEIWPIMQHCESAGIGFKIVPDTFELSLGQVEVDDIAGIPVLDVREQPLRAFKHGVKQVVDFSLAVVLTALFSPIFLVTAIAIKLDSQGPIFFGQCRVGQNGRTFTCWKFRSMRHGAEELAADLRPFNDTSGPVFKMKDDPRCTRVGRFIRRHGVDELPQLWNVIKRDMSLVGPRPALPQEVSSYEAWHTRRLQTRPGITGIWQVSGRSDLSFDEMVMMDVYYIENWSLLLDAKILLRTIAAMITGRGAY